MRRRTLAITFIALLVGAVGVSQLSWAASPDHALRRDHKGHGPVWRLAAGLVRTGTGNWGTLTNTRKYSIIVVSYGNAAFARRLPGRVLTWACGINIPRVAWSADCGISWNTAVANEWILKDTSGNYVPYGDGYSYLADIGNKAFQRRWLSEIRAEIRAHPGVDGVYIDNVVGSLIRASVKYPDSASYRAAMLSFIKAVGPALKAKGSYVAVNASIFDPGAESLTGQGADGTQYIWWAKQIARFVDGINMEHWQQNWGNNSSVRVSGADASQAWDGWERVASAVQRLGVDFYAMDEGSVTDVRKATYLRASFMLASKSGRGAFFYTDSYSGKSDPWNPAWMIDVGRPAGSRYRVGVGWRRNFTAGAVIVNPNPSASQTFTFRRKHEMPDGTTTTSVTLAPATGLLLRLQPAR
jgi:putative glycosyl hydrolase-like family 15 (GHL15) protein